MKPKTELNYYQDAYLKNCDATVTQMQTDAQGLWLATNQTIFYPGGGGQLADHGSINGFKVEKIRADNNLVWHLVPGFKGKSGDELKMKIDWQRRFYMMQQHSGQHLLSHVMFQYQLNTVSVHLGEEYTLIELKGAFPTEEQLAEIETQANALIRSHIPLRLHWTDKTTIDQFPLRRPAGDWETLRIVEITDKDFSACGGTHVKNTAEIGLIKILDMQKIRGHARIKFQIGRAAYQAFTDLHHETGLLKPLLQVEAGHFAERVQALQEELNQKQKQTHFYRRHFLKTESERLASNENESFVLYRLPEDFAEDADQLARTIVKDFSKAAFIISGKRFYFISPKDSGINGAEFLKQYAEEFSMRGGGPPDFVQGLLKSTDDEKLYNKLRDHIADNTRGEI